MPKHLPPNEDRRTVAYLNDEFLNSPDARALRILAEYLEPLAHFRREKVRDTVVFFGSARIKEDGALGRYYRDARELAKLLTEWSAQFNHGNYRFVICSGGGPGLMEAANRGASDAGGKTVGLNIGLPFEQFPNPYITPELSFEFHYFFMRKFWFAYLAKALVVFPGGFGTMDEMFEILTLTQTQKLRKKMTVVLYGSQYWKEVINFDALVKYGTISQEDLDLFQYADNPAAAFKLLKEGLGTYEMQADTQEVPAIAKSSNPQQPGVRPSVRLVDLSHTVEHGMVTYKGLPAPVICDFLSREASRAIYAPGTEFQIGRIDMAANTGTYVDSPFHRYASGKDLAQLPLESLAHLDAVVVAATRGRQIEAEIFRGVHVRGRAVLIRTGWDRHWRTDAYFEGHPFLTGAAAELLANEGAAMVGIDSYNIDDTADWSRPSHTILLGAEIPICEHMRNLAALPERGFRFSAVPVKVSGFGTFPVRAFAVVEG